jgi:allantoate deiminase
VGAVISADPALVERCVMTLAKEGAVGETGVSRPTYSPSWVAAQEIILGWARDVGMQARMDAVGNVWGRVEGAAGGKAIVSGSHIDSQCPGGRYDGALGVVAAYVAMKTLLERFGPPKRTLEMVSLCEEEGSRYPAADFWGSRAIVERIGAGDPEAIPALDGGSIADGMRAVGLDPAKVAEAKRDDIACFIELHIEQGPLLEMAGYPVGIVTGITGPREYWVELTGRSDHAGARPMDLGRDPMAGAAEIILGVINTARQMGRPAVTTVGRIAAEPGGTPIVPERVTFTIDARHPDPAQRSALYDNHEALMRYVAKRSNLDLRWEIVGEHQPCPCDPGLVAVLEQAAAEQGISAMSIPSGAAHDSQQIALIAPVAMIFVQSRDGRSHTPAEFTAVEHAVAGIEVLAAALHRLAW